MKRQIYFSENLSLLREYKKVVRTELSAAIGVASASTILNWEKKQQEPRISELVSIADFFNISIESLLFINIPSLSKEELENLLDKKDPRIIGSLEVVESLKRVKDSLSEIIQNFEFPESLNRLPNNDPPVADH